MVIAVLLGIVAGVASFVPLLFGLRMTKNVTQTSNFGHASILLLSILASFVILAVTAFLCIQLAYEQVLPFVIAEALSLSASALGFGVYRLVKK